MNFHKQPIYRRDGKQAEEQRERERERVLSAEELNQILIPQTRRILKRLFNKDPDLTVKLSNNGGDNKFEVRFSAPFSFQFEEIAFKRKACETARKKWREENDSKAAKDFYRLRSEIEKTGKLKRTASQWRQLVEDVLNGKREPPREKQLLNKRGEFSNKLSPKLRARKNHFGQIKTPANPKGSPYCF